MTEEKIYNLAWREQLNVWGKEKEHYDRTHSELSRLRTEKAWNELLELEKMIREKGFNCSK